MTAAQRNHRIRQVVTGVVIAGAILAILVLRDTPPLGKPPPLPVGFNNNAVVQGVATPDESADFISAVNGSIDRVQIDWVTLEPRPGEYEFDVYDEIYEADLERGIKPLFVFAYAPEWANGGICQDENTGCHAPPTPEHYRDAAKTAAAIAERYPESAGIEIWNEPNTPYFWVPAADPAAYTALLSACKTLIERVDPDMPVVGASISSSPGDEPGSFRGSEFLQAMYEQPEPELMDAISVHAYPAPGEVDTAMGLVEEARDVRDAAGDRSTPLWITETGATTTGPYAVTEGEQEATLVSLYEGFLDQADVEMILVHTLVQPPRAPTDPETGFGVVRQDLSRGPGYCGLAEEWGGEDC